MAANDSNLFGDILTSGSSELMGHLAAIAENSKKRDDALNNSTNILLRTTQALEKSLAFTGKDLNNAFKGLKSYEARLAQAELRLKGSRLDLEKVIKDLDKAIDTAEDESEKLLLQISKDEAELQLKKLNNLKGLNALQVEAVKSLQKTSINLMTNAANQIISVFTKGFTQAYSSMTSAYESSYGTITSHNSYSKADYNRILDSLQQFIKTNGLSESISVGTITEEIKAVLQGGLTGELATAVAKYSVLAQEGGIAANFSDPDTLKLIKKLEQSGGDVEGFLEDMMTQSKAVIKNVGDSFGFANGQINVMMSSMYALANAASLSNEAINATSTAMTAFNGVIGSTELDPTRIYEELIQFSETGVMSSSVGGILDLSAKYGSKDALNEALRAGNMDDILMDVMSGIYDRYDPSENNPNLQAALHNVFGDTFDTKDLLSLKDKYTSKEEFEAAFRSALSAAELSSADQYYDDLSQFQTVEEAYQNKMENASVDLVQLSQNSNILVKEGFDSVISSLNNITISNIASGLGNLGNLSGSGGLGKLGSAVSKFGKYAGPLGMIATGLGLGIHSGSKSYQHAKDAGYSDSQSTGYLVGGLVLGHDLSLSEAEKRQKIEETGSSFDWGEWLKAGGAGAAVGAGIGTIASSWSLGAGTAIGAGIGGVTGLAVNGITQLADMHEASELVNSEFYTLCSTLSDVSDSFNDMSASLGEYSSLSENIAQKQAKLNDKNLKLSEFDRLQLETEIDLDKQHLDLLRQEIALKAQDAATNSKFITDSYNTNKDFLSAYSKLESVYEANKDTINNANFNSDMTDIISQAGLTDAEVAAIFANGGINTSNADGFLLDKNGNLSTQAAAKILLQGMSNNRSGRNYANAGSYSFESLNDGTIRKTALDNAQTSLSNMTSALTTTDQALANAISAEIIDGDYTAIREAIRSYIDTRANAKPEEVDKIISDKNKFLNSRLGEDKAKAYATWLKDNGTATGDYVGLYRVGIPNVPYDNFPALLHKGERVMTATEAAIERGKGPQTTAMNNALTSALESQTSVLAEILERIYSAIISNNAGSVRVANETSQSAISAYKLLGMSY